MQGDISERVLFSQPICSSVEHSSLLFINYMWEGVHMNVLALGVQRRLSEPLGLGLQVIVRAGNSSGSLPSNPQPPSTLWVSFYLQTVFQLLEAVSAHSSAWNTCSLCLFLLPPRSQLGPSLPWTSFLRLQCPSDACLLSSSPSASPYGTTDKRVSTAFLQLFPTAYKDHAQ